MLQKKNLPYMVIPLLIMLIPLFLKDAYFMQIFILFFMYVILATGWNIIGGFTGQVSFGHGVFFAIGAYSSAMLSLRFELSPWIGMVVGMVISAFVALAIGLPFFRLSGHYFAIATLALAGIASALSLNWDFIGGSTGLYLPIKESGFWNLQFGADKIQYYYIVFFLAILAVLFSLYLSRSRVGYYFRAIKENGEAAASLGIDVLKYKLLAFVYSAVIVSIGGTFYSQYYLYVNPEGVLNSDIGIQMVLMTVLGGVGTIIGPIIGAAFLVPLSELIRGYIGGTFTGVDQMIYAFIIILVVTMQPTGIIGFLKKKNRKPGYLNKKIPKTGGDLHD
ncbi:branched-chain amino acid ABC transporter permease [Peribacillus loiseleuriae]|nr:branched-chain amino acid ABC transporter permease [Peribacillus loiseleuriae]